MGVKAYHRHSKAVCRSKRWLALRLLAKRRDPDAVVLTLAADHVILDVEAYPSWARDLKSVVVEERDERAPGGGETVVGGSHDAAVVGSPDDLDAGRPGGGLVQLPLAQVQQAEFEVGALDLRVGADGDGRRGGSGAPARAAPGLRARRRRRAALRGCLFPSPYSAMTAQP